MDKGIKYLLIALGVFAFLIIILVIVGGTGTGNVVSESNSEEIIKESEQPIYEEIEEVIEVNFEYVEEIVEEEVIEEIEEVIEEQPPEPSYICYENYYNCGDFSTCSEVMEVFEFCGGVDNDIHWLDGDDDGIPCEVLCG